VITNNNSNGSGLFIDASSVGGKVTNSQFNDNRFDGISCSGNDWLFSNNEIAGNTGTGVSINNAPSPNNNGNNSFTNNDIHNNPSGFVLGNTNNNTLNGNNIYSNLGNAIELNNASDNTMTNNKIYANNRGIINRSSRNIVSNNNSRNNTVDDINLLATSDYTLVVGNITKVAIIDGGTNTTLSANVVAP
jgi:hypothetical protein